MPDTKIYDSKNHTLVLVALPITDGLADPFVKVTPRGPAFEDDAGICGEVIRAATHENRYDIEITLKGSSVHNAQLAAIHAADQLSPGGAGVGGFLLKDNNGSTIYACDRAWITEAPGVERGKLPGDVTWKAVAVITPLAAIVGGN